MAPVLTGPRTRFVLEGVPRVCFYEVGMRCPEDVPFPSCLRASLEFLGERLGCKYASSPGLHPNRPSCTYAYLLAASGAAFRLLWNAERWDRANNNLLLLSADPLEPLRRAFAAVGYAFEAFFREEYARQLSLGPAYQRGEDEFRARIRESLRAGRPVIAVGTVGPDECCLITGYDEDGEVLLGWSFFQERPPWNAGLQFEECGYFRKRHWFADTVGLLLIGEKRERPEWEQASRAALEWALRIAQTPLVRGRHSGLAAYVAWSQALLRDEEFPLQELDVLRERYLLHNDAVSAVAEGRWYAAQFLKEAAQREPAKASPLLAAAACCETEHDLMWQVWNLQGGIGWSEEKVRRFAQPEVRRQMVPVLLEARRKYEETVGYLKQALRQI